MTAPSTFEKVGVMVVNGAKASAQLYSLDETAKANGQQPYAWLRHALECPPQAWSVKDYEALLPWNCSSEMPR